MQTGTKTPAAGSATVRGDPGALVLLEAPAGPHEARWSGRGADGRDAASGVYYVRMDLAVVVQTAKVVKLK